MEAVVVASNGFQMLNVLSSSPTPRLPNSSLLSLSNYNQEFSSLTFSPDRISYHHQHQNPRKNGSFLTHCSTKPDLEGNNATNKTPIGAETDSISVSEEQVSNLSHNQIPSSGLYSSRGLVFDLGTKKSWDSQEIGSPIVKRYLSDEEERWYMWYHGNPTNGKPQDSIGLAVSNNGIHWERGLGPVSSSSGVGSVMNPSKDWWAFDTESIRPSEIVIMSSSKVRLSSAVYWLYYTGFNSELLNLSNNAHKVFVENPDRAKRNEEGNNNNGGVYKSLPGLAISQDGRHWARIEGEHHSGALLDVGAEKDWDSLFISGPKVVYHKNGDLRMYYHSFDEECGKFSIGMARSRDGMKWVKLGKIMGGGKEGSFDEFGVMNGSIVKNRRNGGGYLMAYEGVGSDGKKRIGLAESLDGLKDWKRCENGEAILEPSGEEDGWDNKEVGYPCLVQMDGNGDGDELRLYYRGIGREGRTGIGMAFSNNLTSFTRWTGFQV